MLVDGSAGTRGLKTVNLRSGGRRRSYLLYVPPGDTVRHPLPLVLAFSGVDNTDSETATATGLLSIAEQQHNMIVAFPEGYDESWNDDAGDPPAEAANVNDVAFTGRDSGKNRVDLPRGSAARGGYRILQRCDPRRTARL